PKRAKPGPDLARRHANAISALTTVDDEEVEDPPIIRDPGRCARVERIIDADDRALLEDDAEARGRVLDGVGIERRLRDARAPLLRDDERGTGRVSGRRDHHPARDRESRDVLREVLLAVDRAEGRRVDRRLERMLAKERA